MWMKSGEYGLFGELCPPTYDCLIPSRESGQGGGLPVMFNSLNAHLLRLIKSVAFKVLLFKA